MRLKKRALLALALFILTGCGANGTAQGGGSENGAGGRVKVGVPF